MICQQPVAQSKSYVTLLTFMDVHQAVDVPLHSSNDIAAEVGLGSSRAMPATNL